MALSSTRPAGGFRLLLLLLLVAVVVVVVVCSFVAPSPTPPSPLFTSRHVPTPHRTRRAFEWYNSWPHSCLLCAALMAQLGLPLWEGGRNANQPINQNDPFPVGVMLVDGVCLAVLWFDIGLMVQVLVSGSGGLVCCCCSCFCS